MILKRYNDTISFLSQIKQEAQMIFIDESGFNNHVIPIFGYAKKGRKCVVEVHPKTSNISVLAAITQSCLLGFQIFRGSVKAKDFGCFLINLIEFSPEILGRKDPMFLDNASIHKAQVLRDLLQTLNIIYLTPYSPFLNPIEEYFGLWKFHFRMYESNDEYQIVFHIVKSALSIHRSKLAKFFVHSLLYREKCLGKEIIE
jgi:hypothetical protein